MKWQKVADTKFKVPEDGHDVAIVVTNGKVYSGKVFHQVYVSKGYGDELVFYDGEDYGLECPLDKMLYWTTVEELNEFLLNEIRNQIDV